MNPESFDEKYNPKNYNYKFVNSGVLVQTPDNITASEIKVVTKEDFPLDMLELAEFSYKAVKHVKSNAIVVARKYSKSNDKSDNNCFQILGIGAGQPNRLNSIRLASEKAKLLCMSVLAYDPAKSEYECGAKGAQAISLKELLKKSDFISLSIPLNEFTKGLITKNELKYVKKSAYIIQTSRGETIDEKALLHALKTKRIAGAAIDVFETEPRIPYGFMKLDNVILTPHIGCASIEARIRSRLAVGRDVINFFNNEPLANILQ